MNIEPEPPNENAAPKIVVMDIDKLRQACSALLDEVAARYGSLISLSKLSFDEDHYWDLPVDVAFGLVGNPELRIVAGQTSEDVAEIQSLLDGHSGSEDIVLGHDLGHLAGLLRRIAFLDVRRPDE